MTTKTKKPTVVPNTGFRWSITTDRKGECQRTGLGQTTLTETLSHLRKRGDKTCMLDKSDNLGWHQVIL